MAYNQSSRFPPSPTNLRLLGPGTYNCELSTKVIPNKAPFLSKAVRNTQAGNKIYTHTIYQADIPRNIGNIVAFISTKPRFPYEALSNEDIEDILCRCGIDTVCECANEPEPEPEVICQGKVRRRLFKDHPPRSIITEGLSSPSKRDHGFDVQSDGTQKRIFIKERDQSPPFYNVDVKESTAFYRGCKWSKWTSTRATKEPSKTPGPADYSLERKPIPEEICSEKVRESKRKTSRQLRFIEMVQQRNILEGRPGPSTYSPKYPDYPAVEHPGPKAPRFQDNSIERRPGPADHFIRREFELPYPPDVPCHATLPEPSFFGIKAARFKPRREEGPSPATYSPSFPQCHFVHCPTAAFGSSTVRFKETPLEEEDVEVVAEDEPVSEKKETNEPCPMPTSAFKSKVPRFKPLEKRPFEQSPADLPQQKIKVIRSEKLQIMAPFNASEGRFEPWRDWMPVAGIQNTPGPAYYCLEKLRCNPAVNHGPLFRSPRFPSSSFQTPGPGAYNVNGGIETVLATHNQKLKDNIQNQPSVYQWVPPEEPRKLTIEQREIMLLNKCIDLLDVDEDDRRPSSKEPPLLAEGNKLTKPKLLRFFLYSHPMKQAI